MRTGKAAWSVAGIVVGALVLGAVPAVATEYDEFPGPDIEAPLAGYTRSDGTVVLTDESFCRLLLGSLWGEKDLTYVELIDKTKKQKKARKAAFSAGSDETTVARCGEVLAAYRTEAPDGDTLEAWTRRAPVVPESLSGLLPEDFVAKPLAQPDEVGDAARTTGFGSSISAPFSVTGGAWLAEVDAVACETWDGSLRDARDSDRGFEVQDNREYLYDIEPGHYFWEVAASDCDWSVDLVPVVLGPVPTPTPAPRAVVPALFGPEWDRNIGAENPDHLTAAQAREAVYAAGLVAGVCNPDASGSRKDDRIWQQQPPAGSLADFGSAVDIWVGTDCDVYTGERVIVE